MVATFAEDANADYVIPSALEAAICILTHEFRSGERRERLFGGNPPAYTRCQDDIEGLRLCVGNFAPTGLWVSFHNCFENDSIGVAVLRGCEKIGKMLQLAEKLHLTHFSPRS
ncbi:MAG: hypothetical protein H0T62_03415 [Parachlamydiaceae bacterium]|nr:hypothetical protein [Parachlamydiaceae bacterium]